MTDEEDSLDDKDIMILELLKENSKLTTHKISKKTAIPITTVHNRIKKLEKEGIIKGYTVVLDYAKLGRSMRAFVLATVTYMLPSGQKISQEDAAKRIRKIAGVEGVCIVTGGTDIIIEVRVKDVDELNDFVVRKLRNVEGVDKTQTMIVLSSF